MPSDTRGRFFYLAGKNCSPGRDRRYPGQRCFSCGSPQIGNGAEAYDHNTTKKFEQLPIKLGKLNPAYFLMIATGEKMSITQIEGSFPQDPFPTKEQREEFVRNGKPCPTKSSRNISWNGKRVTDNPIHGEPATLSTGTRRCITSMTPLGTLRIRVVVQGPVWRRYRLSHE